MSSINSDIGLLVFDASTEQWTDDAVVTDHAIEDGSTVSDHIQARPRSITVTGTISASPFDFDGSGVGGLERLQEARKLLSDLQPRSGDPNQPAATVDFSSDRYGFQPDYLVQGVSFEVDTAVELTARVTLREVLFAFATVARLPPQRPKAAVANDVADEDDASSQPTVSVEMNQSVLDSAAGYNPDRTLRFVFE